MGWPVPHHYHGGQPRCSCPRTIVLSMTRVLWRSAGACAVGVLAMAHASAWQVQPTEDLDTPAVVGKLGAGLDARLRKFEKESFWGAVLVVRDNRVVLLKGYGLADHERGIRNVPSTRFEMNSMTKLFTGAAVLQLAAARKIDVKDPVEKHLGAFPEEKRSATIEQLASHTSGLVVAGTELASETREAFLAAVKRTPREAVPGTQYRYSNVGFSVLAALIERVSGLSYEEYLGRNIFPAAGMQTAIFRDAVPRDDPRFAHGYVGSPSGLQPGPPNPYVWGTRGAGGVWSTVGDIYRFIAAVENGRIVSGEQRKILACAAHAPGHRSVRLAHQRRPGETPAHLKRRRLRRFCEPAALLPAGAGRHRVGQQQSAETVAANAERHDS